MSCRVENVERLEFTVIALCVLLSLCHRTTPAGDDLCNAGQLAKHRGSDVLETKDVQLHLERNWNIRIPGYLREDARAPKAPRIVDVHKQRVQAVQKDANGALKRRKTDGDASRT